MAGRTCRDVIDQASTYIDGDLETTDKFRIWVHILMCPPCRRYFDQMKSVVDAARTLSTHDEDDHEQLIDAIFAEVDEKVDG